LRIKQRSVPPPRNARYRANLIISDRAAYLQVSTCVLHMYIAGRSRTVSTYRVDVHEERASATVRNRGRESGT